MLTLTFHKADARIHTLCLSCSDSWESGNDIVTTNEMRKFDWARQLRWDMEKERRKMKTLLASTEMMKQNGPPRRTQTFFPNEIKKILIETKKYALPEVSK